MPLSQKMMDNPHADRVKRLAALRTSSGRKKSDLFLVEGPQAVREAVTHCARGVTDVYCDPSADPNDDIIEAALAAPTPIYVHKVSSAVLRRISPDAQSIAATCRQSSVTSALSDLSLTASSLIAACWQVRDPGNEGTLIRTADAAGFDALLLVDDCVHPLNPKVIRSTAGSLFHIPVISVSTDEFFDWAHQQGTTVWAADIHGTPEQAPYDLSTLVFGHNASDHVDAVRANADQPLALLFGNEARGLPTDIVARADASVMIPIYGKAESLNLAMSGAVLMYTLAMARHQ